MKPIQEQLYDELLKRDDAIIVDGEPIALPYTTGKDCFLVFYNPDEFRIKFTKVQGVATDTLLPEALQPKQHPYIVIHPEDEIHKVILECFVEEGSFGIRVLKEPEKHLSPHRRFVIEG